MNQQRTRNKTVSLSHKAHLILDDPDIKDNGVSSYVETAIVNQKTHVNAALAVVIDCGINRSSLEQIIRELMVFQSNPFDHSGELIKHLEVTREIKKQDGKLEGVFESSRWDALLSSLNEHNGLAGAIVYIKNMYYDHGEYIISKVPTRGKRTKRKLAIS